MKSRIYDNALEALTDVMSFVNNDLRLSRSEANQVMKWFSSQHIIDESVSYMPDLSFRAECDNVEFLFDGFTGLGVGVVVIRVYDNDRDFVMHSRSFIYDSSTPSLETTWDYAVVFNIDEMLSEVRTYISQTTSSVDTHLEATYWLSKMYEKVFDGTFPEIEATTITVTPLISITLEGYTADRYLILRLHTLPGHCKNIFMSM